MIRIAVVTLLLFANSMSVGAVEGEDLDLASRARVRREAVFLLGDGDRLRQAGDVKAAREKWRAAAGAYRQAEDAPGMAETYRRLGDSYTNPSDESERWAFLEDSIQMMSAAADMYEFSIRSEPPQDPKAFSQAEAFRQEATTFSKSGSCSQALPLLQEARYLYQVAGAIVGEVRSMVLQARCLFQVGDSPSASRTVLEGLAIVESFPWGYSSSERLIKAEKLVEEGKWQEAMSEYQEMLCRSEQARDAVGLAEALVSQSRLLTLLDNYPEAELSLQRALGLLPYIDDRDGESREAQAHQRLGTVYFEMGRLDEGVQESRKALEFWRRSGQPAQEVVSLRELGSGLKECGEYAAALSAVNEAEELQRRLFPDPDIEGDLLTLKALINLERGDFQEALGSFYKIESLYRQHGLARKSMAIRTVIAGLHYSLGRNEEALSIYQEVGDVSQQNDYTIVSQYLSLVTLMELLQQQKYQEAAKLGYEVLPFWEQSSDRKTEAIVRGIIALIHLELGEKDEALAQVDRAGHLSRDAAGEGGSEDPLGLFLTMIQSLVVVSQMAEGPQTDLSGLSILQGLGKDLQTQIKSLEDHGRESELNDVYGLQSMKIGERLAAYDLEGSQREMDKWIALLEQKGRELTLSDLKASFFGEYAHIYSDGVELSRLTGHPEVAFGYAEKARARAFLDQIGNQRIAVGSGADPDLVREERRLRLRLGSLRKALQTEQEKPLAEQNSEATAGLQKDLERTTKEHEELSLRLRLTNPNYAALVSVEPVSLSGIQQEVLDEQTTLVEYFVPQSTRNRDGKGPVLAWVIDRTHFTMVQITVSAADLRERVALFRNLIEAREPVEAAAAELYQDLFALLEPHIRNRNLVIVPHGVLHFVPFAALWDGKKYLVDAYTLSYSPSATALKFARERKAVAAGPILAAGDPDGSLQHAETEARAAARLYGTEPLLGRAATEGAVVARARQAGILHLAAHAILNSVNPLFTRIELAPDEGHDGNLEMHEVFGLDLSKTGLVVLSACSTQMGRLTAGDEIEGLTRAFLYAGTPAVMASLWNVNDASTALFMERFYIHLRKGAGRAEALQLAQKETRKKFPHPYDWAPFVLTGDGR